MFNNNWFRERQESIKTDLTQQSIKDKSNSFIFPFEWLSLKVMTENGEKAINATSRAFTEYMGIITNKDPFAVAWAGSTQFKQVDQQIQKGVEGGSRYEIEPFDKTKAEFFKGFIPKNSGSMEFSNASFGDFGDYVAVNSDSTISIQTIHKITKKDVIERFYVIPNNNNEEDYDDNYIYRISNFTNFYDQNGEYVYSQVEFSSISSLDLNSGQAYESHIQFATIGRGYYFPKAIYDKNGIMIDFTYNENLARDIGVEQIQFEISGNFAFMNPVILGYPLEISGSENNPILPPRRLFIHQLKLPTATPDFKGKNKSNNYNLVDMNLKAMATFEDWRKRREEIVGDKQMSYQGMFETNYAESVKTSDGNINDDNNIASDSFLKLLGNSDGKFNLSFINEFFSNSNDKEVGLKQIDFTAITKKDFATIINFMTVVNSKMELLPLETGFSTMYSLGKLWGIGRFLNWLSFVPGFNWRTQRIATKELFPLVPKIPMLLESGFYKTYAESLFASNDNLKGKLPLEAFNKEDSDTLGVIFGNDSTLSTISFSLTDKLKLEKWDVESGTSEGIFNCSSIMIGQKITENGKEKIFLMGQATEFLPADTSVEYTDFNSAFIKYVVSAFGLQGIGNGDIRTTMFKEDLDYVESDTEAKNSIIFQRTGKTEAGFNNNDLRQINTISNSDLTSLIIKNDIEFQWPLPYENNNPDNKLPDISKKWGKSNKAESISFNSSVALSYNGTSKISKLETLNSKGDMSVEYTIINFKTDVNLVNDLESLKKYYDFLEITSGSINSILEITNNVKTNNIYFIGDGNDGSFNAQLKTNKTDKVFEKEKIQWKIGEMYKVNLNLSNISLKNEKDVLYSKFTSTMNTTPSNTIFTITLTEDLVLKAKVEIKEGIEWKINSIYESDQVVNDARFDYNNNKGNFLLNNGFNKGDFEFKILGKVLELETYKKALAKRNKK